MLFQIALLCSDEGYICTGWLTFDSVVYVEQMLLFKLPLLSSHFLLCMFASYNSFALVVAWDDFWG